MDSDHLHCMSCGQELVGSFCLEVFQEGHVNFSVIYLPHLILASLQAFTRAFSTSCITITRPLDAHHFNLNHAWVMSCAILMSAFCSAKGKGRLQIEHVVCPVEHAWSTHPTHRKHPLFGQAFYATRGIRLAQMLSLMSTVKCSKCTSWP